MLSNSVLLTIVKRDLEANKISEELGQFFIDLTRLIVRRKWLRAISYYSDRENYVIEQLCLQWREFDPNVMTNPRAFYVSIAEKTLWQVVQNEK